MGRKGEGLECSLLILCILAYFSLVKFRSSIIDNIIDKELIRIYEVMKMRTAFIFSVLACS